MPVKTTESTPVDKVSDLVLSSAVRDFRAARRKAAMQDIMARLTGKSDDLFSYEEIARLLKAEGAVKRGLHDIPLDAIVGSVGRYGDFTRSFLPRSEVDEDRWAKIKLKALYQGGLPPIEVYKIGEAYFVLDGNHRVSVARRLGATHIQAYVTEIATKVSLEPDTHLDDLIIKARYADFLEVTKLDATRPEADLTVTAPGQYRVLEEQIEVHRRRLARERNDDVSLPDAAADWYDHVYLPVVQVIRRQGVLEEFPQRTEADLYVWVSQHQAELAEDVGWQVEPALLVDELSNRYSPASYRRAARLRHRLRSVVTPRELRDGPAPGRWREQVRQRSDRQLFANVLVAVSGQPAGWLALEQGMLVAAREGAQLHGLHVVADETQRLSAAVAALDGEFQRRCAVAGVSAHLHIEVGQVARAICQRARWTDLVVVKLSHPPGTGPIEKLESGFRRLIQRCSRPLLAVPGAVSPMRHALVAYDGSLKSDEGLFVATYLAVRWRMQLTVLTVVEANRATRETLADAQEYLQEHEVDADYVEETGPVAEALLSTAGQRGCDFIIMGGYGFSPMLEVVLGSTVDQVLRASPLPTLICR
jgi:nucleotide-binding universal stress UspA family protein